MKIASSACAIFFFIIITHFRPINTDRTRTPKTKEALIELCESWWVMWSAESGVMSEVWYHVEARKATSVAQRQTSKSSENIVQSVETQLWPETSLNFHMRKHSLPVLNCPQSAWLCWWNIRKYRSESGGFKREFTIKTRNHFHNNLHFLSDWSANDKNKDCNHFDFTVRWRNRRHDKRVLFAYPMPSLEVVN